MTSQEATADCQSLDRYSHRYTLITDMALRLFGRVPGIDLPGLVQSFGGILMFPQAYRLPAVGPTYMHNSTLMKAHR